MGINISNGGMVDLMSLIWEAWEFIKRMELLGYVIRTPLYRSEYLSGNDLNVYLKLENLQRSGSFKVRGVIFAVHKYMREGYEHFLTVSTGNHAVALAYVANILRVKATVVVPETTPRSKVEDMERYGAEVIKYGRSYVEAEKRALEIVSSNPRIKLVHTFNDHYIIAGHATIGLEILEELPNVNAILIPLGGGALPAGVSYLMRHIKPDVRVYGVQPESAPFYVLSLKEGKPVVLSDIKTIADGLASRPGEIPFEYIRRYLDNVLLVSEGDIERAIYLLLKYEHVVAEGAGAIAIGPIINGDLIRRLNQRGAYNVVAIITGSHIDIDRLRKILENAYDKH
ncbi:threonine ammonia-lyase [Vulcanisaeta distributa]|uniref:Pyridoxal-5'-phosphate-dependent protein beta subunit n=1 Tax=Vulcanisaeta distributa (strain DSM 14429 / JCM 11212 / NBRC 100878 / IC-017) TaxID=572478 RepID=E1QS24_VULDI|nr:threonine/serine dehydratase [Vulcanisaeta distributa]ADN51856.1 Pyridoxal-5'-phosphate-dependent protein beta subunit [Vulcanisaeta distributa DSM 14429]